MNSGKNNHIRIEELKLGLDDDEASLKPRAAGILGLAESEIVSLEIARKNIDSRQKKIWLVFSLDVVVKDVSKITVWDKRHRVRLEAPYVYELMKASRKAGRKIAVVGSGPCGLFAALLLARAGLKPWVIERGQEIDKRVKTVEKFIKKGEFNPKTNVQFGEGGAGTFSDGKLYTLVNDPRSKYIFSELVKAGAPEEILWSGAPHIGTDRLRQVIKNLRKEIEKNGGRFSFESCLTGIRIKNKQISEIEINKEELFPVDELVLAAGHSARDTYAMLHALDLEMSAKPFSIGLRIEHQAEAINRARFGAAAGHPKLGTAKYKLVQHIPGMRSVYTFCMCPGGYVMAAASEAGGVVTNGMSEYAQDGENSNSALLVPVGPEDFASADPLAGIEFQRRWEQAAFLAGGSDYSAPVQLLGDFLRKIPSSKLGKVRPSYRPDFVLASLDSCLPGYALQSLRAGIPLLDKKLKGFAQSDAVLTGVETRSSSPVRLERNERFESNIKGIYPAGEGAGHAGGIVSSALDGMRVAEGIIGRLS